MAVIFISKVWKELNDLDLNLDFVFHCGFKDEISTIKTLIVLCIPSVCLSL